MTIRAVQTVQPISKLSDFPHRIWLQDGMTDEPFTIGTVRVSFCASGSAAELNGNATCELTHFAGGEWRAVHDQADIAAAFAAVNDGVTVDRVLRVVGSTDGMLIDRWQLVPVAPIASAI